MRRCGIYVRSRSREANLDNCGSRFLRVGGRRIAFSYLLAEQKQAVRRQDRYDPE